MNILLVGGNGFIGNKLDLALRLDGHLVTIASRNKINGRRWCYLDFEQSKNESKLNLTNIDLVINAAGIYTQSKTQNFVNSHTLGPIALFKYCKQQNISVLQISALGAEQKEPNTEFLSSKRKADQYLLTNGTNNVVLYPGIILGEGGYSTFQLSLLASSFIVPYVFAKDARLPSLGIEQFTQQVLSLVKNWPEKNQSHVLLSKAETIITLINNLRNWMGKRKALYLPIPQRAIDILFLLFPHFSIGLFNKQSMAMMHAYRQTQYNFINKDSASVALLKTPITKAYCNTLKIEQFSLLCTIILSLIWISSGVVSLINFEQSLQLASAMITLPVFAKASIVAGSLLDIALGVLIYIPTLRRKSLFAQLLIIFLYTLLITIYMPHYWLHPFAPIIKNAAVMMMAWYLLRFAITPNHS